jgi:hypothetical protein
MEVEILRHQSGILFVFPPPRSENFFLSVLSPMLSIHNVPRTLYGLCTDRVADYESGFKRKQKAFVCTYY